MARGLWPLNRHLTTDRASRCVEFSVCGTAAGTFPGTGKLCRSQDECWRPFTIVITSRARTRVVLEDAMQN